VVINSLMYCFVTRGASSSRKPSISIFCVNYFNNSRQHIGTPRRDSDFPIFVSGGGHVTLEPENRPTRNQPG
jgi:hypothetical protein